MIAASEDVVFMVVTCGWMGGTFARSTSLRISSISPYLSSFPRNAGSVRLSGSVGSPSVGVEATLVNETGVLRALDVTPPRLPGRLPRAGVLERSVAPLRPRCGVPLISQCERSLVVEVPSLLGRPRVRTTAGSRILGTSGSTGGGRSSGSPSLGLVAGRLKCQWAWIWLGVIFKFATSMVRIV